MLFKVSIFYSDCAIQCLLKIWGNSSGLNYKADGLVRVITKCFLDRLMGPVSKVKLNFFPAIKEGLEAESP